VLSLVKSPRCHLRALGRSIRHGAKTVAFATSKAGDTTVTHFWTKGRFRSTLRGNFRHLLRIAESRC